MDRTATIRLDRALVVFMAVDQRRRLDGVIAQRRQQIGQELFHAAGERRKELADMQNPH